MFQAQLEQRDETIQSLQQDVAVLHEKTNSYESKVMILLAASSVPLLGN